MSESNWLTDWLGGGAFDATKREAHFIAHHPNRGLHFCTLKQWLIVIIVVSWAWKAGQLTTPVYISLHAFDAHHPCGCVPAATKVVVVVVVHLTFVYCNFRKPKAFLLSFEAWKRAGPGSSRKAIVWLHAFWWRRVLPPPFGLCEEDSLSVYSGKTMLITTSLSYVYVGELKELLF